MGEKISAYVLVMGSFRESERPLRNVSVGGWIISKCILERWTGDCELEKSSQDNNKCRILVSMGMNFCLRECNDVLDYRRKFEILSMESTVVMP
jgi:hypothetical protein